MNFKQEFNSNEINEGCSHREKQDEPGLLIVVANIVHSVGSIFFESDAFSSPSLRKIAIWISFF
jgi:hypothetical protein